VCTQYYDVLGLTLDRFTSTCSKGRTRLLAWISFR
jgi:hypothetical protein